MEHGGFRQQWHDAAGPCVYGASKRAVRYLNKALRKDAAGTGIQICALSPGIVVTDLLVGDYDLNSDAWRRAKRAFNVLGDTVETVVPFLADGVLKANRDGAKVVWLTGSKAMLRFLTAAFRKRDLFSDMPGSHGPSS